jgi:hypothetical protein
MNFALKTCKVSGALWKQYNSLQKCPCVICVKRREKRPNLKLKSLYKPINRVSKKRQVQELQYAADRIIFLAKPENKICPITRQPTTEIHHVRKRRGFADEWARLNNIPLLLDQRYWLAVSRIGHQKIEENPTWAYEKGYSQKNNTTL